MKNLSKAHTLKLEYYKRLGTVIFAEVNNNGYLNLIVKTNSKIAPVKELCFGSRGACHVDNWYSGIDGHGNPVGLLREWSLIRGLTFKKIK